jgi:type IV pilus assembly protein PilB
VRKVCLSCRKQIELPDEVLRELQMTHEDAARGTIYKGAGCIECNGTGHRGRQGVYEVMPMSPKLRDLVLDRAPAGQIKKTAIAEGMLTLRRDALEKLKRGLTSVEEVLKETAADKL